MRHPAALFPVVAASLASAQTSLPPNFVDLALAAAQARAQQARLVLLADFGSDACAPCRRLAATWSEAPLQDWLRQHAVAVRVDAEHESELARTHAIAAYPTIVVFDADGGELGRIVGWHDAATLQQKLDALRAVDSDDPKERERVGDRLLKEGDPDGAMQHYLWYWDNADRVPKGKSLTGVRASFFVRKIADFAKDYEPMRAAMLQRRDAAERRALNGGFDLSTLRDMMAIDQHLGDGEAAVRVIRQLPEETLRREPILRGVLLDAALPKLCERREYREVLRLVGDPPGELAAELQRSGRFLVRMPEEMRQLQQRQLIARHARVVEAAYGAGEDAAATALGDGLLALDDGAHTWLELLRAAKRADNRKALQELAVRAMAALPEANHAAVRSLLQPR